MPRTRIAPLVLGLLLVWCGGAFLRAGSPQAGGKQTPSGSSTEPVPIEDVQEVTAVEPAAPPTGLSLVGRMHPALVHFPIAWLLLLVLADIAARFTGQEAWAKAGMALLVLTCLSFLPAVATGLLRASSLGNDPETLSLMALHRNLNLGAGVLVLAALVLRLRQTRNSARRPAWSYLVLVVAAAALVFVAGHLGGKMVFGPKYLPF